MKSNGFSLVELLIVMAILAILMAFGFNSFTHSKLKAQTRIEQQYLLQLPSLIEDYFSEHLNYPNNLNQFLSPQNDHFLTPKKYYIVSYTLSADSRYSLTATLNARNKNSALIDCYKLIVHSSGGLQAFDRDHKDISSKCWN